MAPLNGDDSTVTPDASRRMAVPSAVAAWVLVGLAGAVGLFSACGWGPCPVLPSALSVAVLAVSLAPASLGASVITRRALVHGAPAWPAQIVGGVGAVACTLIALTMAWIPRALPDSLFPTRSAFWGVFLPLAFLASALVGVAGTALERRAA